MCSTDGEYPDVYNSVDRTARKAHQCAECGRTINAGERYNVAFMAFEDKPYVFKTCIHCRVGHGWLIQNCNGFMHTQLAEEMSEHEREYPAIRFGFIRIRAGMHRKWQRFDGAGLMPIPPSPRDIAHVMEHAA